MFIIICLSAKFLIKNNTCISQQQYKLPNREREVKNNAQTKKPIEKTYKPIDSHHGHAIDHSQGEKDGVGGGYQGHKQVNQS